MDCTDLSINSEAAVRLCVSRIKEIESNKLPESVSSEYIKQLNSYIFQNMKDIGIDYKTMWGLYEKDNSNT